MLPIRFGGESQEPILTSPRNRLPFNSVLKLLPQIGSACADYQDRVMLNLKCKRIQCDECWSFVYAKQKNVPEGKQGQFGYGDVWTWVALDADTQNWSLRLWLPTAISSPRRCLLTT
jgi:hypothetical protein